MITVLIPLVGRGIRIQDKYNCPKPLVKINNKTIIEHCIETIGFSEGAKFIFVIRQFKEYGEELGVQYTEELKCILNRLKPHSKVVEIDYVTEGPANSALLAEPYIAPEEELIITNCDQTLKNWNSNKFLDYVRNKECDGCVTTYPYSNIILGEKSPYSFIELDNNGYGIKLEEKICISLNGGLNGIHYWKRAQDFIDSAKEMIKNNDRVNNEFYISKSYNFMIKSGKKIISYMMEENEFFPLGSTEEIEKYLKYNEKL